MPEHDNVLFYDDYIGRSIYAGDKVYINNFNGDKIHEDDILDYLVERCDFQKVDAAEMFE